ncbi:hypothetical protein GIB67_016480, partial [Kingdonia uniflora]
ADRASVYAARSLIPLHSGNCRGGPGLGRDTFLEFELIFVSYSSFRDDKLTTLNFNRISKNLSSFTHPRTPYISTNLR